MGCPKFLYHECFMRKNSCDLKLACFRLRDSDSDEDDIDLSFLDCSKETFVPPPNMLEDPFLNRLCDKKMLLRSIDAMGNEQNGPDVNQADHAHMDEENEEQVGVEFRVHDPTANWREMKPQLGECYDSPAQIRFALTNYAVRGGYQIYFEKSDRNRVIAKCGSKNREKEEENCPFRLYTAQKYNERTFQIKGLVDIYLCARNFNFGSLVTRSWIAKHYLKDIISKPKMTLREMKDDVLQNYSVHISLGQCQRARVQALEMIEGKLEEHYARIWDFASEIRMLSGIPCVHAQAAINFIHKDAVNFIASWYHKKNYIVVYTDNILPVNGSNMWPRTEFIKPLPPFVRRMPGRPKVKRRKSMQLKLKKPNT
ncbi:hypothetical protein LXL04_005308 [Taraxacum kok-saghyz]